MPLWTQHAQYLFPHSADTHEHGDQALKFVLVTGDAPVTILSTSLNLEKTGHSRLTEGKESNFSCEPMKTSISWWVRGENTTLKDKESKLIG